MKYHEEYLHDTSMVRIRLDRLITKTQVPFSEDAESAVFCDEDEKSDPRLAKINALIRKLFEIEEVAALQIGRQYVLVEKGYFDKWGELTPRLIKAIQATVARPENMKRGAPATRQYYDVEGIERVVVVADPDAPLHQANE